MRNDGGQGHRIRLFQHLQFKMRSMLYASLRSGSRIFMPDVDVEVQMAGISDPDFPPRVLDMGVRGVAIEWELPEPVKVGRKIQVWFHYPNLLSGIPYTMVVRNSTRVLHKHSGSAYPTYRLGCEFADLDEDAQARLMKWNERELAEDLNYPFSNRRRSAWDWVTHFFHHRGLAQWDFGPVHSLKEMVSGFNLVYHEYLKRNYIKENAPELYFQYHSLLANAWIFTARNRRGHVGGTVTLVPDHPDAGLPIEKIFPEELYELRQQGRRIGELTMLAIQPSLFPRKFFSMSHLAAIQFIFELYRTMHHHAWKVAELDTLVIAVSPSQVPFYKRLYFNKQGKMKAHVNLNQAPVVFLQMDIQWARDTMEVENRMLYDALFDGEKFKVRPDERLSLSRKDLEYLLRCDQRAGLLTPQEKTRLIDLYDNLHILRKLA